MLGWLPSGGLFPKQLTRPCALFAVFWVSSFAFRSKHGMTMFGAVEIKGNTAGLMDLGLVDIFDESGWMRVNWVHLLLLG